MLPMPTEFCYQSRYLKYHEPKPIQEFHSDVDTGLKYVEHVSKACHLVFVRCQKWMINCRRDDLLKRGPDYASKNCRLFGDHFGDKQLNKLPESMKESAGLVWNAVPTLFNTPNPQKRQ